MADSVTEQLSKLRFEGAPVETLYLDEVRVHEDFIGQVGAVASFMRSATKEVAGGLEMLPVTVTAGVSSGAGVTWNLDHPITQVLVLRAVLQSQGLLHGLDDPEPGRYVVFSGAGKVSRLGMFDDLHREHLQEHRPGLYEQLEAERAMQEKDMRETDGPDDELLWLLTINKGASVCAATLMSNLLRPPFRHWERVDSPWEIFGLCRRIHEETRVPWLAPLYLCAKF
jgi:hypothetical protein